ncbi:MAG: malate/lactate/ureidoglycolate dehydrogenase [Burkholderiales bacterium]
MAQHIFHAEPLAHAIATIVAAGGSDAREARLVAENLVLANLVGHDSHGIGMIPRYVDALLEGGLKVNRHPTVKLDSGTVLALDGQMGYGQAVGVEAMGLAIERAKKNGVCVMALGYAHHLGRIGHWAEQAVAQGCISIHFVNVISRSIVAPWGGSDARFGTNPFTVGIPLPDEPPFILDMATSAVAQGKIRVAYNKGEKVPPGRLIDDKGNPTAEARYGVVEPFGALVTFGEHKGYGLAVACELLGGALTGGGTWHSDDKSKRRVWNGMLTIVVDPKALGNESLFAQEARAFLDSLRRSPAAPGFDKVRVAGEPEREYRARREREGIPVDPATWEEIVAAAAKLGLDRATVEKRVREGG